MSIHKTLRTKAALARSRNVFTRWERIERLKEKGDWTEEKSSIFGLRKVRTVLVKAGKKKKKAKKEEGAAEGAEGAAAAPAADGKAAAPAAGGKAAAPAAGAKAAAPAAKDAKKK